jgi:hypothetical protein
VPEPCPEKVRGARREGVSGLHFVSATFAIAVGVVLILNVVLVVVVAVANRRAELHNELGMRVRAATRPLEGVSGAN